MFLTPTPHHIRFVAAPPEGGESTGGTGQPPASAGTENAGDPIDWEAKYKEALGHSRDWEKKAKANKAAALANQIAPEHLELSVADPETLAGRIRHAGAIFMGRHTAEALGDYCAGPNHVLPTSRTARFSSPLGVYDFQKRSSLIMASATGAATLSHTVSVLARGEGLTAHARSADYRGEGSRG